MRLGLTKKQHEVLMFIERYTSRNGYAPSFEDIKGAMGLASKSGVHRLVHALIERGHIVSKPNGKRTLTLAD